MTGDVKRRTEDGVLSIMVSFFLNFILYLLTFSKEDTDYSITAIKESLNIVVTTLRHIKQRVTIPKEIDKQDQAIYRISMKNKKNSILYTQQCERLGTKRGWQNLYEIP